MEKATFGAGCFWGIEFAFRKVEGVKEAYVGYAGGNTPNPTYQEVCSGQTGHAEVVQVEFNPDKVSYEELLELFWAIHDPTTLNRQGPDVGTQYRSAIYYHSPEQEASIKSAILIIEESTAGFGWADGVAAMFSAMKDNIKIIINVKKKDSGNLMESKM